MTEEEEHEALDKEFQEWIEAERADIRDWGACHAHDEMERNSPGRVGLQWLFFIVVMTGVAGLISWLS